MGDLRSTDAWIAEQLPLLLAEHGVPAASVAVLADGDVVAHAAGVLNMRTGVEATTDSVFQIGSVTKVWTSVLVMQLLDEGLVDLDAPVRRYLPDFRVSDEEASAAVTVRHLLTHTGGFDGDIEIDTGVGDDSVEKFLAVLHDVSQLFPPGQMFSYNNAGFSVLGRIVEVLRGTTYDQCLQERIARPLGLEHVAPTAYEAVMHRAAMGHIEQPRGSGLRPAPVWGLERGQNPAGSMLSTSARDLVTFARMLLDDGVSRDGTRLLAPGSTALMTGHAVDCPDLPDFADAWGLGIARYDAPSGTVVGHNGTTIGQRAILRIAPEAGVAVAVLANGGGDRALFHDVLSYVLAELAGVSLDPSATPVDDPDPVDMDRCAGTYSMDLEDVAVHQEADGRIWVTETLKRLTEVYGEDPVRTEVVPYRDGTLITRDAEGGAHTVFAFSGDDEHGRARFLHMSGRSVPRAVGT